MPLLRKWDPAVSRDSYILLGRLMQLVVEEDCKVRKGQVQLCVAEAIQSLACDLYLERVNVLHAHALSSPLAKGSDESR